MTPSEYADFVPMQVAEFALQMTMAGEWELEDALDKSLAREELLFDGTAIHGGHRFLRALAADGPVAWVWEGPSPLNKPGRWLYQITIDEELRGRGFGRAVLTALERKLSREGTPQLMLNVFRWNEAALKLYERCGYEVVAEFPVSLHLRKLLLPQLST
jgi:ribosomal protein S18 acetylase RimI-like enzyme